VVIPSANEKDLHGLGGFERADLRLFMAGNQFFLMPELLQAFHARYPEVGTVFYATLPPGLLLRWITAGSATFQGRRLPGDADVYASITEAHAKELQAKGFMKDYFVYAANRLVIAVAKGNPKGIQGVRDLARPDVRLSQTNPITEGITAPTLDMYRRAGGDELVWRIMSIKAAAGTTRFTDVHHRETPDRLMKGEADAGNVWITEYLEYERQGWPIDKVEPGPDLDMRDQVKYVIGRVDRTAKNTANADKFLAFMKSREAQGIYAKYGFVPAAPSP
jgi:ABC-type molybdate transport system substrate-binding protein